MQQGGATDWAIIGAGVRENDRIMREKLLDQDCLTTLIELDPGGRQATEIIDPMIDYLPVEDDNQSLITAMADPRIRIVSLTITEGGYFLDPETGGLDVAHPDIRHDAENLDRPRTAFGAILVVFVELWAIVWIQNKFMQTPFLRATFQVVLGGALVFAAGALIGNG